MKETSSQNFSPPIKVGLLSLGCAKNLVDSEIMIGYLQKEGMEMTPSPDEAHVLIVNTCSFIDESKQESIDAILEMNERRGMKRYHKKQKLIVAGCMAQRFSKDLAVSLPEVDAFIGLDEITKVAPLVRKLVSSDLPLKKEERVTVASRSEFIPDYDTPRFRLTPKHFSYVKIAEGCNHPCAFCIIPQIRGKYRSRTIPSILSEVRELVQNGVKEINLISQDTTYFGMDRWKEHAGSRALIDSQRGENLATLLREIQKIEGDFWVRLLYTHPAHWSDELISVFAQCDKVARYVDIPLQHISSAMLKSMRRETSSEHVRSLIGRIRKNIEGVAIRSTFIVGFPGETEEDFQTLLDFISEEKFERVGVFRYSAEEGTRGEKMESQVEEAIKKERFARAMSLQKKISSEVMHNWVGRKVRVLVEKKGVARTYADAPEVDGQIFVPEKLVVGDFANVTISGVKGEYDWVGQ